MKLKVSNLLQITLVLRERGAKDFLNILERILPRETGFFKSYDLKLLCFLIDWRYSCSPNKNNKDFFVLLLPFKASYIYSLYKA